MLLAAERTDSYIQFFTVVLLFVFVLAITYATTRWIANYQKGKAACSNLEVIETLRISTNKYLQIVRAGEKYLVIAVGKDEVHMLAELKEEDLINTILSPEDSNKTEMDFKAIWDKIRKRGADE